MHLSLIHVKGLRKAVFSYIHAYENLYYAFCELPNSRILPITVSLIASRIGVKYLRGS